jgi:ribonuclease R
MFTTVERKKRPEGEVIEVIERNKTDCGVIDIQKNFSLFRQPIKDVYDIFYSKIE